MQIAAALGIDFDHKYTLTMQRKSRSKQVKLARRCVKRQKNSHNSTEQHQTPDGEVTVTICCEIALHLACEMRNDDALMCFN